MFLCYTWVYLYSIYFNLTQPLPVILVFITFTTYLWSIKSDIQYEKYIQKGFFIFIFIFLFFLSVLPVKWWWWKKKWWRHMCLERAGKSYCFYWHWYALGDCTWALHLNIALVTAADDQGSYLRRKYARGKIR